MKYKHNIKIFFLTCVTLLILFIAPIYYYDPLKLFHKPYVYEDHLDTNMRQQAVGIIKNWDFDSVILGTSMLENTSSLEANNILGGTFINISIGGSDFYERKIILNYLVKNKNINKIIYSLDSYYLNQREGHPKYNIGTFDYLYDDSIFNDFKAYLNDKYLKCIFKFSNYNRCIQKKAELDRPNAWYQSKGHSKRFGGLQNWINSKNDKQIVNAFNSIVLTSNKIKNKEKINIDNVNLKIDKAKSYIDENILNVVAENRQTEFILVFPPYSRLTYGEWVQYDLVSWKIHEAVIRYLVLKSIEYKNIKIYGFEHMDFLDDIANYKDLGHYHHSINSSMLSWFASESGLLTNKNIDDYIDISYKKALNYDITKIADQIKDYSLK